MRCIQSLFSKWSSFYDKVYPNKSCWKKHFQHFNTAYYSGGALVLLWAVYRWNNHNNMNSSVDCLRTFSRVVNWSRFVVHSEQATYYKYLIVGTGEAAKEAVQVLRTKDPTGSICILSDQTIEESNRPTIWSLLSGFLREQEEWKEKSCSVEERNAIKNRILCQIEPTLSERVQRLDIVHNRVLLSNGEWIRYGKLLLSPCDYLDVPLDVLVSKDCTPFVDCRIWEMDKDLLNRMTSHLDKFHDLENQSNHTLPHVTIVGGGWNAILYVCKLKQLGFPITMVFPDSFILARYLPKYLCDYISSKLKAKGVDLVSYALVRYISKSTFADSHLDVHISRTYDSTNTGYFHTDYVLFVATDMHSGLWRWWKDTKEEEDILEVDVSNGGILCNAELAAASDVYVAGSAVSFPNRYIGRRREQVSEQHNRWSGRLVGTNMAGGREYYRQLLPSREIEFSICMPMYLFGDVDSSYDSVGYFRMNHQVRQQKAKDWSVIPTGGLSRYFDGVERGVVFFLKNNHPVGICLWNVNNADVLARNVFVQGQSSPLRQIASELCDTKADELVEKSQVGRTTCAFHSSSAAGFKRIEILWETRDHFVSGRTQNDLKREAFQKAIFGKSFSKANRDPPSHSKMPFPSSG